MTNFPLTKKACTYLHNGENLYIFNATQKEESGGYDAAIVYWSKFILPVEKVIKRLKKK